MSRFLALTVLTLLIACSGAIPGVPNVLGLSVSVLPLVVWPCFNQGKYRAFMSGEKFRVVPVVFLVLTATFLFSYLYRSQLNLNATIDLVFTVLCVMALILAVASEQYYDRRPNGVHDKDGRA